MTARSLADVLQGEDKSLRKLIPLLLEICIDISEHIPLSLGVTEEVNPFGEKQAEMDVWANGRFVDRLRDCGMVREIASEEMGQPAETKQGEYSVVLDPLDGSSNLKSDNLVGTIVGLYREKHVPAKGRDLSASMYFLYGPYQEAVVGLEGGVFVFVRSGSGKGAEKFISDGEPRRFPSKGSVYGIGGLKQKWPPVVTRFVQDLEGRRLKLRYGGSFVGDFNQILNYGGFFAYPELTDAPQGKLRLQFESNPIALITEKAGGSASTGRERILDIEPSSLEQRVPTYVGNADLVSEFERRYKN